MCLLPPQYYSSCIDGSPLRIYPHKQRNLTPGTTAVHPFWHFLNTRRPFSPRTLWVISAPVMPPFRRFPSSATCVMTAFGDPSWRGAKIVSSGTTNAPLPVLRCSPQISEISTDFRRFAESSQIHDKRRGMGGVLRLLQVGQAVGSLTHIAAQCDSTAVQLGQGEGANDAAVCRWYQLLPPPCQRQGFRKQQPLGPEEGPSQARGE